MLIASTGDCFRGGSGPPLVLLHGGFSTWVEWRSLLDRLTPTREVIAPTLPGSVGGPPLDLSGPTMLAAQADYVEELLDAQGWAEPVQVVGDSFGGVLAIELAARGRAAEAIALAPPWVAGRGLAFYMGVFTPPALAFRLTEPLHALLTARRRAVSLVLHGSLRPAMIESDDAAAMIRSFGRAPWLRFLRRRVVGPGMPDFGAVRAPVTLVWGTADFLVPQWMWRRWEEALPDASVEILPRFPHIPQLRDPDRIAALILRSPVL